MNFFKYRSGIHGYITAPGGSGKSHMIAALAERLHDMGIRVGILARSEKLLSQNKSKFSPVYTDQIGIYCAGLGEKTLDKPITIASVQSITSQVISLGAILVDECDEISEDEESQYQQFFTNAGNPVIIGFTATPFRTNSGRISWGEEITNIPIKSLMDGGYLTPPTSKVGTTLDLSDVPIRLGEYANAQLEEIYLDPQLLELSIAKIKQYSAERSSVLIFCQSLKHADILAYAMEQNAMPCMIVDGNTDKEDLGFILNDFEEGRIKYLLNVMLLTRGYDMPSVDMIVILRSTKSKRLFEQMLYRGTRLKEGKKNFLVLDMGNNFEEHGPLGSPHRSPSKREQSTSNGKICPVCEEFTPPLVRECPSCAYQFPEPEKPKINHAHDAYAGNATVYTGNIVTYDVMDVTYKQHRSKSGNETLMVRYHCDYGKYGTICEWYSPFSTSDWARDQVVKFFKDRDYPLELAPQLYTFTDLLAFAVHLKKPARITVDHSQEFPRIKQFHWQKAIEDSIPW